MALTLDSADAGTTASNTTTLTLSHDCAGSDRYLAILLDIYAIDDTGGDYVTGVTYNGVAATQINTRKDGNVRAYIYGLAAPATGTHDIVVSTSANCNISACGISFNGAAQSSQPNAQNVNGTTAADNVTVTVTSTVAGCWFVTSSRNSIGVPTAGAGVTGLHVGSAYGEGHSNGTQAAGAYGMTWSMASAGNMAVCGAAIGPLLSSTPTGDFKFL